MELYLIRHAEAAAVGERGVTRDEDRPLTAKGETQAGDLARTLRARGVTLDRLYTSPLVRARQTAEILLRGLARHDLALDTSDELAPGGKPRKLGKFLFKQEGERIGLVGHMPHLAEFAGWLIGDKEVNLNLAKAGVAYIRCPESPSKGVGALRWMITPEWFV